MSGDFGGTVSIILLIGGLLLNPIATHLFIHKAISKLYMVNSKDDYLFN